MSVTTAPPAAGRSALREMLGLAAPLVAGHAGNQLMSVVDTIMVAPLGAASLGGVGIGNGLYFTLTIVGLGCVLGMDPLVAQAAGAGELGRARRILRHGSRVAWLVGLPLMGVIALSPLLLPAAGVEPGTAGEAARYVWARLPNVIPFLLFAAGRSYIQALGKTLPIVIAVIVANAANLVGNALLIYGDGALAWLGIPGVGLPALGVVGAGLSSSIAAAASLAVVLRAIRALDRPGAAATPHEPALERAILRLGFPVGLQMLAELGAFAGAGLLAGTIGREAAAGHQIAITLASFTFTVTLGVASATSVLVGRAVGRGDTAAARRAGILGLAVAATFMSAAALVFVLFPASLARLMAADAAVVRAAAPLVVIAAVFQISDGLQAVGAGALRGAGDTRSGVYANLVGHYVVGLPLAIALAFGAGLGAPGLWWGLSAGLTAVAVWLVVRFLGLSSRHIARS